MTLERIREIARGVVAELARGNYESLTRHHPKSRVTADQFRSVISDYGCKLVLPPEDAYQKLDAVQVRGAAVPTWSVRIPVWTKEEGLSDLTLEMTIALGEKATVELDDLRVL